uniref:Uncharacterized protein n=1 Tax=Setaria viridis TaxID=4556 RepID=A0A4U6VFH1_SETVI|nr:hypothetical protein SEVIR_4G256100v2 [Setaria viridis]
MFIRNTPTRPPPHSRTLAQKLHQDHGVKGGHCEIGFGSMTTVRCSGKMLHRYFRVQSVMLIRSLWCKSKLHLKIHTRQGQAFTFSACIAHTSRKKA